MTEALGIIATVIVLISFTSRDVKWIRLINAFGAVLFIIYGIAINSLSVTLLNISIALLQVVKIIELERKPREKTNHPTDRP